MSNRSELRDFRSEVMHFKNKYKFVTLKITLMPQIKKTFVWSNVNTKSTLQYPFELCSDVSFIGTIFSRNWHLLFVLILLISNLTFVFLLLSLLVSVQPDISKIFFRIMSQNNCSHTKQLFTQKCATNYQTYLENQLNNFWTWNNSMLRKFHTGDSAEWVRIIWAQFRGQVLGTPRFNALKLFPETALSSDHKNNLKWAILGT
jgi:Na+-transporting methylmalonyl-CoA/oxaloacetate decarboxylase gamma subunit